MHEYSIVQSIIESCYKNANENGATKITKVEVKIGVMSGVEIQLLQTAFDTFKEESICASAEFKINLQPLVIFCHDCKKESILDKNEYSCPHCSGVEIDVVDGEGMYLMQLEMI